MNTHAKSGDGLVKQTFSGDYMTQLYHLCCYVHDIAELAHK